MNSMFTNEDVSSHPYTVHFEKTEDILSTHEGIEFGKIEASPTRPS